METEKVKVSKGKIRIDNSDGTYTEINFVMPHDIADSILCDIIDWENQWMTTVKNVELYQKAKKEFLNNLEIPPHDTRTTRKD
jgi:hypothetical protein